MRTRFFIGAIPFFDSKMAVHAYRMITQDGDKLLGSAEDFRQLGGELLAPALELVQKLGVEPFAGDRDFFIDISKYQLLIGMPASKNIPPDNVVCIIDKETLADAAARGRLDELKSKGYRIAHKGLPDNKDFEDTLKYFDFMLLSCADPDFDIELRVIRPFVFKTRLVITDVPDIGSFNRYSGARGLMLSGGFYEQPVTKGISSISPLKINALRLLREINSESFELGAAAMTIERDAALSISLLRFLNKANPDRSRKIDSIRSAVAILGQNEVKKWANVTVSVDIGEDRPSELTRLSLLRAKFAENLARAAGIPDKSGSLFIAGLFSLLDVMFQMPLSFAIDEVAADDEIKSALFGGEGPIYEVLSLVLAYERADWHNASIIMVRNGIDIEDLAQSYLDALYWYRQLLDSIDRQREEAGALGAGESAGHWGRRVMAVDYGEARTGLAVSDGTGSMAGEAWTIKTKGWKAAASAIAKEAESRGVGLIAVGHPVNMDGTAGASAESCARFAQQLRDTCSGGAGVVLWDERMTTMQAHRILDETGNYGKKRKEKVDAVAASLILESYLMRSAERSSQKSEYGDSL